MTACIEALKSCAMIQTFMQDPRSIQRLLLQWKYIHNKRNFCTLISEIMRPKKYSAFLLSLSLAPHLSHDILANENGYVLCYQKSTLCNRIGQNECFFSQADSGLLRISCNRVILDTVQSCKSSEQKQAVVSIYNLVGPEEIGFRYRHNAHYHY